MNKKTRVKSICVTALFTAIIALLSPVTVPSPIAVPITLQTAVLALAAFLLGVKKGFAATVCYILLGAAGLPVFSGFCGGVSVIAGPTGGFIIAFPAFSVILSLVFYVNKPVCRILSALLALLVLYAAGITQYSLISGASPKTAAMVFFAYFIKDALMLAAAYLLCLRIRPRLLRFMQSK